MFNVGTIAAGPPGPVVQLSDAFLYLNTAGPECAFALQSDGVMRRTGVGRNNYVYGQWYVPGVIAGVGAGYEVRRTHQAGMMAVLESSGVWDAWQSIGVLRKAHWSSDAMGNRGRVLFEIRRAGETRILASARYWNHSSMAPA